MIHCNITIDWGKNKEKCGQVVVRQGGLNSRLSNNHSNEIK